MTFDDMAADPVLSAITITGTRSTDHRPLGEYRLLFAQYLAPFALPGIRFYLGGARGIDSLALLWLASETQASLTVVVPGTLEGQPADARHAVALVRDQSRLAELVELAHPMHPSTEGYHHRNRWMVDRSDFVIGFPRGEDTASGTWYTLDYAATQNKPRLILPV
ncbi:DNA-processing protein DprA [Thermoactinospora rubra]|uniref:DNA-processing protein DprA n=1 Tax=Thermoactinospora rubra TaxID=1088767 RepID=UPI001981177C|nr:DNA-processing protein DprA [Thermoactinospora rubra]